MSDDQMMPGSVPPPAPMQQSVAPAAPRPKGAFGRNILLGAAALVVLAAIIGIVAYVLLSASVVTPPPIVTPGTPSTGGAGTGTGTTTTGTVPAIPTVTNAQVFTPRNPFEVIDPISITTTTSSSNTTGTSSSTALTLTDIKTVNGEKVCVVKLGGVEYTVAEGDKVGTSNWQVVQINTSSVVFLYGDDSITISLGQGTSK